MPSTPTEGAEPVVFRRPPWLWWRPAAGFVAFLALVLIGTESTKGTVNWSSDLPIAAGFAGFLFLFSWITFRVGRGLTVSFDGWDIAVGGGFSKDRTFDAREVVRVRWAVRWARGVGFGSYMVRLRGREAWHQEFAVPMTVFKDQRVYDHFLSRVAAVPGVQADERTAEELAAWRRARPGPDPPPRPDLELRDP